MTGFWIAWSIGMGVAMGLIVWNVLLIRRRGAPSERERRRR